MFARFFPVLLFSLYIFQVSAQVHDNEYRDSNNPLYWQNHRPDKGYWQQDVQYKIDANIDEEINTITAKESLNYWNNSPDTLDYVYFHLYQNAFIKGSYLHQLELLNKVKPRLGKKEAAGLGIVVNALTVDGQAAKTELDNSIMKVYLPQPLYPGSKVTFNMSFETYYDNGATRRRMQMYDAWGYKHYNGTQWFPKISVYDRKLGWDTYQHLNKEFYSDFGQYDVTLNFASNYIVEATGVLQNKDEALPADLLKKIDIANFAGKKWNEAPSIIIPYKRGERKSWHYIANNVHDFAFTADPSYRMAISYWHGIQCVGLVQEPHARGWQNSADYVAKVIQTFSENIGMYQYPKMVAADAQDGMEYPMLTLDGGSDPTYRGLLVHEIGHNWFYGMVGSNETYRAAMDEGFTQFLTAYGLNKLEGGNMPDGRLKSKYRRYFAEPTNVRDRNVFNPYTFDALNQNETPLNTHSDDFNNGLNHGGGYRLVYYKTATMLYNLQYTLGDSLFQSAFQHYFKQWQFGHPYFEDFKASFIQYTHVDLNWFFDEWFETTKVADYGITGIKKLHGHDNFTIHLRRTGAMQMPIDLTVTAKDGAKYSYNIPNTWFSKNTPAVTLPKWYGWGTFNTQYTAHVSIPSGIKSVQIDTTYRLGDRDLVDNYKTKKLFYFPAIHAKLDGGTANPTDRRKYRLYVRPDLWWNGLDGVKAGVHFEGDYLSTLNKVDATVWWNTHLLQQDQYLGYQDQGYYAKYKAVNYTFNYTTPVARSMPKLQVQLNSRFLDGLWYHKAGLNWLVNDNNTLQLYGQTMWRPDSNALDYLIYHDEWSSVGSSLNTSLNASWTHRYNYFNGNGQYKLSMRAPMLNGNSANAFDYAYAQLEVINNNHLGKLGIKTRLFGRYGTGTHIPSESALFLAGANPEELMEDKYTRNGSIIPTEWQGISRYNVNHLQQGGGLNLRGYAGYFVADERNGSVLIGYKGRSGMSANIEVDVDNYIPLRPRFTRNWLHVDLYGFADGGLIELSQYSLPQFYNTTPTTLWSDIRIDVGIGTALTIKNWGVFDKARPLTIRFDVPFLLNRAPYGNPEYATFRYVVGVNRCF
jgi:hypothetical protein